jgi:hypothetical protein
MSVTELREAILANDRLTGECLEFCDRLNQRMDRLEEAQRATQEILDEVLILLMKQSA